MRLIDADAFSAFIKKTVHEQGYDGDGALRICDPLTVGDVLNSVCAELDGTGLEGFKNAPSVDAVPVVYCKDCIHWDERKGEKYCEEMYFNQDDPKFYCGYAERRENAVD